MHSLETCVLKQGNMQDMLTGALEFYNVIPKISLDFTMSHQKTDHLGEQFPPFLQLGLKTVDSVTVVTSTGREGC